jgi:hypothetical protein
MNIRSLLLPCLFSALTTTLVAAPPQYSARKDIATGFQHLQGLAVADFNGDGIADIAVTDSSDKRVVVYLGKKDNTFSAPISTLVQTSVATTTGLHNLVAGDFNEDGKQDLVVSINGSEPFIYLSGNGDGTFTQRSIISGSLQWFQNARVVDVNHDSHLDLVINANPGFVEYQGDGHGNFQRPSTANLGPPQYSNDLLVADFNGDNNVDVITALPMQSVIPTGIVFNAGNGDGTFKPYVVVSGTSNIVASPTYLAVADLNGDGKQDILIGETSADILFYGKGDGTFDLTNFDSPPTLPPINPNISAVPLVAAADVNGDGKVDAIIADDASQTVDVDINNGSGSFMGQSGHYNVPDVTLGIDPGTSHLAIADVNGDGLPDIILTNNKTQNVFVFFSIRPRTTPTATLTSSANSQFVGTSLSFTVKITGTTNYTPTGTVTLLDGTTSLGQQTLDSTGQVVFSLSNLAAGQHSLTASYSGDTNFLAATSSALTQSITDFQVTLPTSSQTVTAGGTATYSLTVTPAGGLTGSISLTCSQLPSLVTCDPVTVPITGQPATATLTVHTTAPVTRSASTIHAAALGLLSIALTAFLPLRRRRNVQLLAVLTACTLIGLATGCSSGSSGSKTPTVVSPGTPQGSTQFTITSSITLGGQTFTRTTNATLVVQ